MKGSKEGPVTVARLSLSLPCRPSWNWAFPPSWSGLHPSFCGGTKPCCCAARKVKQVRRIICFQAIERRKRRCWRTGKATTPIHAATATTTTAATAAAAAAAANMILLATSSFATIDAAVRHRTNADGHHQHLLLPLHRQHSTAKTTAAKQIDSAVSPSEASLFAALAVVVVVAVVVENGTTRFPDPSQAEAV